MSAKAVSEAKGKELLNKFLEGAAMQNRVVTVTQDVNWNQLVADNPWLNEKVRSWHSVLSKNEFKGQPTFKKSILTTVISIVCVV